MVVVAPAEPLHVEKLAQLLEEKDRYYGSTEFEPLEHRVAQITDALFGEVPAAFALLAWNADQLVGLASYSFLWPAAGVSRSLYLKELYVTETSQRQGIGTLLIDAILEIAGKNECSRVEWTTDKDSMGAQRFYAELGVPVGNSTILSRDDASAERLMSFPQPRALRADRSRIRLRTAEALPEPAVTHDDRPHNDTATGADRLAHEIRRLHGQPALCVAAQAFDCLIRTLGAATVFDR